MKSVASFRRAEVVYQLESDEISLAILPECCYFPIFPYVTVNSFINTIYTFFIGRDD